MQKVRSRLKIVRGLKGRIFGVDCSFKTKRRVKLQKVMVILVIFKKEELYYRKLIEEAERWLKNKGVTIHGPLNLNILNGYDFIDGF